MSTGSTEDVTRLTVDRRRVDGTTQVDVQVPEGTAPGQAMWVQLPDVPASSQNPDSPAAAEARRAADGLPPK